MNRLLRYAVSAGGVLALGLASACGGSSDADAKMDPDVPAIEVVSSYIPEPPASVAAAYVTFRSRDDEADRLLSATSDVTDVVELHRTRMDGGTMSMEMLEHFDLPARGELVMEPGGIT